MWQNASQGPSPPATIDRASPLPLHAQFRRLILSMIESGALPAGAKLPTERELAERYRVSIAPIRQAILDLAREGLLQRVRGRGTFVRGHPLEEKLTILSSFTESMHAQHARVDLRVVRQEVVDTPEQQASVIGGEQALLLERLAMLGDEPVALLTTFLPLERFPDLTRVSFEGRSLYRTLEERYGAVVTRADLTVEVARCTEPEARLLQLRAGFPVLSVEGVAFDEEGPVEAFRTLYHAERFRLRVESVRRDLPGRIALPGKPQRGGYRHPRPPQARDRREGEVGE